MQTIDTRGLLCPAPLIMAKKAIKSSSAGEKMLILSNSDTSCQNLVQYLDDMGANPIQKKNAQGEYEISITVPIKKENLADAQAYCAVPQQKGNYVVVIKSDTMGMGDNALGQILIRAFVNSLKDADSLPSHIILYNGGVKLALQGTDTGNSLLELAKMGIEIIVCGTCVDFFDLKDKISTGTISNMYQITKLTAETGHVVYP